MAMDYRPEGHEYITHHTYTGFGCAVCGKEELGHKEPAPKKVPAPTFAEQGQIAAQMSKL